MSSGKILIESLAKLKREIPNLNLVDYSLENLIKKVIIFNKYKLTL